jgi:hypothetical protein
MHWSVSGDVLSVLGIFENAPGWVGLAFPETAGRMSPADAVIARGNNVDTFALSGRSVSRPGRFMAFLVKKQENGLVLQTDLRRALQRSQFILL